MGEAEPLSVIPADSRATLLVRMREPFREKALKLRALAGDFRGEPKDIEQDMNSLWLQSVTNGYETHALYYHSPLWARICQEVFLRDQFLCAACGRDAEVVHHCRYGMDVMMGRDDNQLVSLCHPCHRFVHFHKLQKTPMEKWDKQLRKLQKLYKKK